VIDITSSKVCPYLTIYHHSEYEKSLVESALFKINKKPIGYTLLSEIDKLTQDGKSVTIQVDLEKETHAYPKLTEKNIKDLELDSQTVAEQGSVLASRLCKPHSDGSDAIGVSAKIHWDPYSAVDIDECGMSVLIIDSHLSFVSLAHELFHAYWIMRGNYDPPNLINHNPEESINLKEENRATGIEEFSDEWFSENGIRAEHDLPRRNHYFIYYS